MDDMKKLIEKRKNKNRDIIIEFGPGENKKIDYAIGVDLCTKKSVDYIANLSEGLGFLEDESVDEIHAYHFLEHIENLELFMSEMFRVLKKNGKVIATVPHFSNPYFYSDYTHKSFWGLYTINYFTSKTFFNRSVPNYYNHINFNLRDIQIIFSSPFRIRNKVKKVFQKLFNTNRYMQELYEEQFVYLIPCYELYFELEKNSD